MKQIPSRSNYFYFVVFTKFTTSQKTIPNFDDYLEFYDPNIRPSGDNGTGPVKVYVDIFIRSISNVDEANMEYTLQLTLRETWIDKRLAYGDDENKKICKYFVLGPGQAVWRPDTFIYNEKHAHKHDVDRPNVFTRIYKNGQILYSVRLTLTLSCPMNLKNYPLDIQHCLLKMASYAWTTDDIEYQWKNDNPIQLNDGLEQSLPQFTLANVTVGYCHSKTITGLYSCLMVEFEMKREFGYYIVHLYLPGILLVFVSWISFWLDPSSVPGRVTLGVTTLLTMATQASSVSSHLPPVSYAKAIDIWIGHANILEGYKLQKTSNIVNTINRPWAIRRIMFRVEKDAKFLDRLSRVAFPATFLISNIIYWIYYTKDWFH